jgi:hypothetical protein
MEHVEIAISTIGGRIHDALRLANKLTTMFDVLIVHQTPGRDDGGAAQLLSAQINDQAHLRYIACDEAGVAKSRNVALRMSRKEYLWFLDDDVDVDLSECGRFFTESLPPASDVITIAVSKDNSTHSSKFPSSPRKHSIISILSVGTIEIILKPDRTRAHECWFPEDMGAGTSLPVGDEPVFLSRCMRKGLKVSYYPACLVSHPNESSGDRFLEPSHCRARGLAFARIYGTTLGLILIALLYARHAPRCIRQHDVQRLLRGIWLSIQGLRLERTD